MHALDQQTINILNAEQVITGVFDAVKELIENALDSGAKTIKIKLEDIGLKKIQVTDDGSGITPEGRDDCCLAHTTSKISTYDDLENDLSTFGFRGEALHSLCCLSDVVIITRCRDEENATEMVFNRDGVLQSKRPSTAPYGTSIIVSNLLAGTPVRVREERLKFNSDRLRQMIGKYFLAAPTVRFVLYCAPHLNVTRPPMTTLAQAAAQEFGAASAATLTERKVNGNIGSVRLQITALVPGPNADWKLASTARNALRQHLFVNGRPVHSSAVDKAVNEACWKKFGSVPKRFPRFVICLDFFKDNALTSSLIDVNRDAAKSAVAFSEDGAILRLIEQAVSFSETQRHATALTEWPSSEAAVIDDFTSIEKFGTFKWSPSGNFGGLSLFTVSAVDNSEAHIAAVKTEGLLEAIGAGGGSGASRTPMEEIIPQQWDRIMELQGVEPRVAHVARLN